MVAQCPSTPLYFFYHYLFQAQLPGECAGKTKNSNTGVEDLAYAFASKDSMKPALVRSIHSTSLVKLMNNRSHQSQETPHSPQSQRSRHQNQQGRQQSQRSLPCNGGHYQRMMNVEKMVKCGLLTDSIYAYATRVLEAIIAIRVRVCLQWNRES